MNKNKILSTGFIISQLEPPNPFTQAHDVTVPLCTHVPPFDLKFKIKKIQDICLKSIHIKYTITV